MLAKTTLMELGLSTQADVNRRTAALVKELTLPLGRGGRPVSVSTHPIYDAIAAVVGEVNSRMKKKAPDVAIRDLHGIVGSFLEEWMSAIEDRATPPLSATSPTVGIAPIAPWFIEGIMPGIVAIVGETGSGKTTYVHDALAVDCIIRYAEPFEELDNEPHVLGVSSFAEAVFFMLLLGGLGQRVVVDGARKLVYELTGPTMSGGIAATMFTTMTDLNNACAAVGAVCGITVNPMTDDHTAARTIAVRIASSVAGVIYLQDMKPEFTTARRYEEFGGRFHTEGSPTDGPGTDPFDQSSRGAAAIGAIARAGTVDLEEERLSARLPSTTAADIDGIVVRRSPNFTL